MPKIWLVKECQECADDELKIYGPFSSKRRAEIASELLPCEDESWFEIVKMTHVNELNYLTPEEELRRKK